jgi:hypothetical protein
MLTATPKRQMNPERNHPMGDKKGKKDKAKAQKQKNAKQAADARRKKDKQQAQTP